MCRFWCRLVLLSELGAARDGATMHKREDRAVPSFVPTPGLADVSRESGALTEQPTNKDIGPSQL
jgi:hypothetical protein